MKNQKVDNNKWQREIDEDMKLSKRLMQPIPKRYLAFIDADCRPTPIEDNVYVIGGIG